MNTPSVTRFQNDQVKAKQSQMLLPAAKNSLKTQHHVRKPMGSPSPQQQPSAQSVPTGGKPSLPGFKPMYNEPAPISQPQQPQGNPVIDSLVREIHLDKLMSSQEMMNANTLVRLRNHFHGRDQQTPQETAAQVLGALTNYLPKE